MIFLLFEYVLNLSQRADKCNLLMTYQQGQNHPDLSGDWY